MKVVIQRVLHSSVSVDGEIISSINKGISVMVGIFKYDTDKDLDYMTRKILNIRLFEENETKWKKSVVDCDYEILVVSEFTLCHALKNNKVSFHNAMATEDSRNLYTKFIDKLKLQYKPEKVKSGQFGAHMYVNLCNDGPVTIELSSQQNTVEEN